MHTMTRVAGFLSDWPVSNCLKHHNLVFQLQCVPLQKVCFLEKIS